MPETTSSTSTETTTATPVTAPSGKGKGGGKSAPAPVAAKVASPPAAVTKTETPAADPHNAARQEATDKAAAAAKEADKAAGKEAPKGAKTLEQVRAERRAKSEGTTPVTAEGVAKPDAKVTDEAKAKPDEEAAAKTKADEETAKAAAEAEKAKVPTDITDAQLANFTKLNRDLRTARERVKELEATNATATGPAAQLAAALKLKAEGKHFEAIRVLGLDFDAAAAEVLRLEEEKSTTDPKLRELQDKIDPEIKALREKLAALEEGQTKTKEQIDTDTKAKQAEAREAGITKIIADVTAAAETFPYLSQSADFVKEALKEADAAYDIIIANKREEAEARGKDPKAVRLTDEEKNNLLRAALEEGEAQHAARAKLYAKAVKKPAAVKVAAGKDADEEADKAPTTIDSSVRGNVTRLQPRTKKTLEEIKQERRRQAQ